MPKRTDIHKIMVIGSGPIIIGQAAEFDYSGTQACMALREEGYEVVLVNSNPATIMTSNEFADRVYIEPLTLDSLTNIMRQEMPDALLPTLGGQIGLNLATQLDAAGVLDDLNVQLLGTSLDAIDQAEDRERFKALMTKINEPVPPSTTVQTVAEALDFAEEIGYPVIVRPAFTMGGTGGGMCQNETELRRIAANGLELSPVTQCLIEKSIAGYKEIEFEVMRDAADNAMVVCAMENFDPVGIHTGDSIVVAPTQTLTDREYQMLRNCALKLIRALKIEGGCNVQLALDPRSYQYYVIEVNPRVSRSSALASKATGYPIAKLAAKIAVGLTLDEIKNPVTEQTWAEFEPALDYVVVKIPRWPFDKFTHADRQLGTQMKATGEVMALGRNLAEALQKAVQSLEIDVPDLLAGDLTAVTTAELTNQLIHPQDDRLFYLIEAFRRKMTVAELAELTQITPYFLGVLQQIVTVAEQLPAKVGEQAILWQAKRYGFSDATIARAWHQSELEIRAQRQQLGITPVYKMVDTCAAEFASQTPYFYSTYGLENESQVTDRPSVIVLGSGPIRIGQGVEFDYATVHSVKALQKLGYEAIVINSNPETVSTDFSVSDKLYFEPLTLEKVLDVIELEHPVGVIVQFGGQTAINLAAGLAQAGVNILGTTVADLDRAEDREAFDEIIKELGLKQPIGMTASTPAEVIADAKQIGYPVLVRPSYVLGGKAMEIVYSEAELKAYLAQNPPATNGHPILVDEYLEGLEGEVDAICDGENVLVPGIMQHIESSGVHSGDSMAVYPPQEFSAAVKDEIIRITKLLTVRLKCVGIMNIQFIIRHGDVYVLEVNPRASRTVPFLSKITGVNMAQVATQVIMGQSLPTQGFTATTIPESKLVHVKAPVFSFSKLADVDSLLGPEMKSTGEVMGSDASYAKALYKAFVAAKMALPDHGSILLTIEDQDKAAVLPLAKRLNRIGYRLYATAGTAEFLQAHQLPVSVVAKINEPTNQPSILSVIHDEQVDVVVNTMGHDLTATSDGYVIRQTAIMANLPVLTSFKTVEAMVTALENRSFVTQTLSKEMD